MVKSRPQVSKFNGDVENRHEAAMAIWRASRFPRGTLVEVYLRARLGEVPPEALSGAALRFHPNCPFGTERHPAMVALMRNINTNAPQGIHRTALTPAGGKLGRKMLGAKRGSAIKISADEDVATRLTIGEGIETTIAGMLEGFMPAWALGDANGVGVFPVLAGIESITMLVDNDAAGFASAKRCSLRWTAAGHEVFRVIPRRNGADMADLVCVGA